VIPRRTTVRRVFVVVPVGDPGVDEDARGIVLEDLPMTFKFANVVSPRLCLSPVVAVPPAKARIHFPQMRWIGWIGEPEPELGGIGQRLKDALGRSGNFDLDDNGVAVGA